MATESRINPEGPKENFSRGLFEVQIPELGSATHGKVRDMWRVERPSGDYRVLVTTDRQSAFDRVLAAIPGKGQVLNLTSGYWFAATENIIPNHLVSIPHPSVTIAREAEAVLPVEIVVRRYMARSSTDTSIYRNYADKERRTIYGIDFPEGLQANQEFPMGTIVTPTTKAEQGHDEELTDEQALEIVDKKFGDGTWVKAKTAAITVFDTAHEDCKNRGLILADTKYEMGVDRNGQLMLVDEVHTPDSSRWWLLENYQERFERGENPIGFDKEILRRWLADQGFHGDGPVPAIPADVINQMAVSYKVPFQMITGRELPGREIESPFTLVSSIRSSVLRAVSQL